MTMHKRVHTGERPLMCDYPGCGKMFSESSNLSKHRKSMIFLSWTCDVMRGGADEDAQHIIRSVSTPAVFLAAVGRFIGSVSGSPQGERDGAC